MQTVPLASKWTYVTHRASQLRRDSTLTVTSRPLRLGDFVLARVTCSGKHDHIETPEGRRARIFTGDHIVGVLGNRYATDCFEGYVPTSVVTHLLTAGGVIGSVVSAHEALEEPTQLEVVGTIIDEADVPVTCDRLARPASTAGAALTHTIAVVGSSMNSGKTTATAAIVRGCHRSGLRAGAAKVTGSGSGKDRWAYVDAGATAVVDFLDMGMPSTFGYPLDRLSSALEAMRAHLADDGATIGVLEIADGLLQSETQHLVRGLNPFTDSVVLTVGDALSAHAGVEILRGLGLPIRMISGLISRSPLASREAEAITGLPVVTADQLANGRALELLRP